MIGESILLSSKSLSKDEVKYKGLLDKGVDKLILRTNKFVKSSDSNDLLSIRDEELFKEEFRKTNLYTDLNSIMRNNALDSLPPIRSFYSIGSRLGYQSIRKSRDLNKYDEEAISILLDYIYNVVLNLNQDAGIGLRRILYDGVVNDTSLDKIMLNLLDLPITVVDTFRISTRTSMIAGTEYSRSVNTGTLQAFSNSGVKTVNILTTGLPNVCDVCINIESKNPYTLEEAMRILPVHPNCACSVISANVITDGFNNEPLIVDLTT